jgi:chromosome segregation ATPase
MPKPIRTFIPVLAVVWLAGCATMTPEQCDPRNADAGFATKFSCSTQGVYEQRVEAKERLLLDEQKTNQLFREVHTALEQERREVGQQRANQQNRHDALNRSMKALLDEIKNKARGDQRIEAEIAAVEKEMSNVNNGEENRAEMEKLQENRRLKNKLNNLEQQLFGI